MIREKRELINDSGFWEEEEIICELEKSKKSFYRFSRCRKDSREYISIREFVTNKDNELVATKKGMTISGDNLKEFIECLSRI